MASVINGIGISVEAAQMVLADYGYYGAAKVAKGGAFVGHTTASILRTAADFIDAGADYLETKGNEWENYSKGIELLRTGQVSVEQLQALAGQTPQETVTLSATPQPVAVTQTPVKPSAKTVVKPTEEELSPQELAELCC